MNRAPLSNEMHAQLQQSAIELVIDQQAKLFGRMCDEHFNPNRNHRVRNVVMDLVPALFDLMVPSEVGSVQMP
jgi:hypothetical protein